MVFKVLGLVGWHKVAVEIAIAFAFVLDEGLRIGHRHHGEAPALEARLAGFKTLDPATDGVRAALFVAMHGTKDQQRRPRSCRSPAIAAQCFGLVCRDGGVNGLELKAGDSHINSMDRCMASAGMAGPAPGAGQRVGLCDGARGCTCRQWQAPAIGAACATPAAILPDWKRYHCEAHYFYSWQRLLGMRRTRKRLRNAVLIIVNSARFLTWAGAKKGLQRSPGNDDCTVYCARRYTRSHTPWPRRRPRFSNLVSGR
ncbi:hypothetical protein D3C72_1101420 [compost metagenome]